ncbi:hypothetical protein SAMN05192529_13131 [Arachidicoccus rhizosphaerae]|uniref:Uncharacterized protein n=1 Tax=Arachidicoccus rhizosphaerae TaxID=551991 RepID=A0A1H4CFT6_9BACT|nr:hypothetical protein [Arachidicoccus rhizosphaerae]SEA59214.1 hypothetical protein SAMN05192529_13131 [Arachidicoccus rhizosphaerae]
MDVAGMEVVLGADYEPMAKGFAAASQLMDDFKRRTLALAQLKIAPEIGGLEQLNRFSNAVSDLRKAASQSISLSVNTRGVESIQKLEGLILAALNASEKGILIEVKTSGENDAIILQRSIVSLVNTAEQGATVRVQTVGEDGIIRTTNEISDLIKTASQGVTVDVRVIGTADITKLISGIIAVEQIAKPVDLNVQVTGSDKLQQAKIDLNSLFEIASKGLNVHIEGLSEISKLGQSIANLNGKELTLNISAQGVDRINDIQKAVEALNSKNIELRVNSEGADQVIKIGESVKALQGKTIEISVKADGVEQITKLQGAIKDLQNKAVTLQVNTEGANQITKLNEALNNIQGKDISINISSEGASQVAKLSDSIKDLQGKAITLTVSSEGLDKITQTEAAIKDLQGKMVTIPIETDGLGQLAAVSGAIKEIQGKTISLHIDAAGIDQVTRLSESIKDLQGKTISLKVDAEGLNQVEKINDTLKAIQGKNLELNISSDGLEKIVQASDAIKDLQGKSVKIFTEVTGIDKVLQAQTAIGELKDKNVKVVTSITGLNKITQLNLAVKALEQATTGGIALDIKTTDMSQLLATLKQVQALGSGKTSLQVSASGKGLQGLNDSLQNAATYASAAESALKSLQATANTTLQFLAAQNASLANYMSTVAGISAQSAQSTAQLTQAIQNTTNAAQSAASATIGLAGAAQQASQAAENIGEGFNAASARVNTFTSANADLNNSIIQNVQILNQYRARMAEVSTEIGNLAKMEGLSEAEAAANSRTIAQLGSEYATLKQQVSQATSTINAQAKATIAAEGSYNDLQQQLTLANQAYRRLTQADRDSSIGAGMIKNIGELSGKLKEIDATMGIYVRNVGNYSSATNYLNQTVAQLSGEIPNFFQSMKIGFMSISNNIQPIMVALENLRAENIKLAASGEPTTSAFKAITSSLLSWQTGLFIGVGLLSKYGGELVDWATGADKAKAAAEAFKKEQEALQQIEQSAIKSAGDQIGKLTALNAVLTDSEAPMSKRKSAYDELQKLYPSYLKNIKEDDALNGALAETINNKLVPAIIAAAQARAYQDKINKLTSENIDLEEQQAKAVVASAVAMDKYSKAAKDAKKINFQGGLTGNLSGGSISDPFAKQAQSARNAAEVAIDAQDAITKHIGQNNDRIKEFIKSLQTAVEQTGNLKIDGADQAAGPLKKTKEQTDALAKSQNALADTIKQVDAQLQAGQISALDAAQQKLAAYQKDLTVLFQNKGSKVKVEADLSQIDQLQAKIKDLTASGVLKQFKDALNINAQLNTAGITDSLEKVKSDLSAAKKAYQDLVTGKNALPLDDSRVVEARNEVSRLKADLETLTKQQKIDLVIKTAGEQSLSIEEDLKNGWITPLEAAKERVKSLETEIKALQKAGADASVIIPMKVQWANAKQDSAVAEVADIVKNAESTFSQANAAVDLSVDLKLVAPLDGLKEQVSLKKKEINQLLKALSKVDTTTIEGGAVAHLLQDTLTNMIGDVNAAELAAQFQQKIQDIATEGLAGIGEMLGGVFSGGDIGDLFGTLMQNVGGQLENLGKWMITTAAKFAILKEAFEKALKANPILGVAAGVAVVALGAALKAAFQNKQSQMAFADGGVVYGRTNAIIGEYQGARNNPEVVAPLNKLKNILQLDKGASDVNVSVNGVIENDVIRLAMVRADKNNNK